MTNSVLTGDKLKDEAYQDEAFLVGLFWKYPEFYLYYDEGKVNSSHFGNKVWKFFFQLGRLGSQKHLQELDDLSISKIVTEYGKQDQYKSYGEYDFIYEIMEEIKDRKDNFDAYYDQVKKYSLLRQYRELFGDQVAETDKNSKYNYKKMDRFEIQTYWQSKVNEVALANDAPIKEINLFDPTEMREMAEELDTESDYGMPLYNSEKMNEIMQGWGDNTLTIVSGFSGNGKTSYTVQSYILGCLTNQEKLVIAANEMGAKAYRKIALITIMGSKDLYDRTNGLKGFDRKNINKGDFSEEEKKRINYAIDWVEENLDGDNAMIKFVPLDTYTIEQVEMVFRFYAHRGYSKFILDTAKPTEGGAGNQPRWQRFVEDFEKIGSLVDEDSGIGISVLTTVQAADEAIRMRYLDERCLGDSKKIKNVAHTVVHMRPVRDDEFKGGKKELEVYDFFPKDMSKERLSTLKKYGWKTDPTFKHEGKPYGKMIRNLDNEHNYYLFFTSKNRRNESNLTGLDVLVVKVDFNTNKWTEIGWTKNVERDMNY